MTTKIRIDQLLVERNIVNSREKAKRLILSGTIRHGSIIYSKPGQLVDSTLELSPIQTEKYVSRGGLKIEGFFKNNISIPPIKNAIDVGSSTGGFSDFLLQNNANKITCVDVGQGILDWKIRKDKRVTVLEKFNARYLKEGDVSSPFDFCSIDVSFISLDKIIPAVYPLLEKSAFILALVKPQFEAGKEEVSKGSGVVKNKEIQLKCVDKIKDLGDSLGLSFVTTKPCCIKGPKGNQEHFIYFKKS